MKHDRFVRPKPALIAVAIAAVIVYGSLYPFEFQPDKSGSPLESLLETRRTPTSRGDILSNILLYIPFGVFAADALGRIPALFRLPLVTLAGLGMCLGIELIQFYASARASMMFDVYTNTAGTLLGAVAGGIFHARARGPILGLTQGNPFPAVLIVSWLGYRLYPYVPTIDLHKYWDALKPLIFEPSLVPLDLFRHTAIWLVLAVLLEALAGAERRRLVFFLFIPAVLLARVLILDVVLSPAEVAGGVLALILWIAALSHLPLRGRAGAAVLLMIGVTVTQSLEPYVFLSSPRPFGWIPFLSFMQGSIEVNIRSMFEKVFTYGSLLWLLIRAGLNLPVATAFSGVLVFSLRYAQTYLPGRSAEITDFIMVVILALVIKLLAESPALGQPRGEARRA